MHEDPVHGLQVRRLATRGPPRVYPVLEQVLVVRIPARAERDGRPAVKLRSLAAHLRRHQAVVVRFEHRVFHRVERTTRAVGNLTRVPSTPKRREIRRCKRRLLGDDLVPVVILSPGDRELHQTATVGAEPVLVLHLFVTLLGTLVHFLGIFVPLPVRLDPVAPGFLKVLREVLRSSKRLLQRFPLEHQRPSLGQRALLRPLGLVRIPGPEVDVHDGYPRLGLERRDELLGEVQRFGQEMPGFGVSAQVVRRD
mmetsp:Transcript_14840/g.40475  ORF Transcript_14840/g.40475 Transcript_14840/m.40475 type:complete len:253 (+) Transcript_14840:15-773(+)